MGFILDVTRDVFFFSCIVLAWGFKNKTLILRKIRFFFVSNQMNNLLSERRILNFKVPKKSPVCTCISNAYVRPILNFLILPTEYFLCVLFLHAFMFLY